MAKWEYRVFHDLTAPELAPIGEEGWEFITVEFDDDGEILNALAKRPRSGSGAGGSSSTGGGGGGGGGGSGPGGAGRRRRRRGGGGNPQQGGSGSSHRIGPMS